MLFHVAMLLAQAQEQEQKPAEGPGPLGGMLIPLMLMFVVVYFLMILPNKRQRQQQDAMLNSLKKNDEIITSGGIIGTVANIKDTGDEVTIKIDENVRMRVLRSSIVRILTPREPGKDAPPSDAKT